MMQDVRTPEGWLLQSFQASECSFVGRVYIEGRLVAQEFAHTERAARRRALKVARGRASS